MDATIMATGETEYVYSHFYNNYMQRASHSYEKPFAWGKHVSKSLKITVWKEYCITQCFFKEKKSTLK